MFDATGMMRMATKSTLKNDLRVNVSGRSFGKPTTVIYDVSALLRTISFKFISIVKHGLTQGNVVMVFDRYYTNSKKSYMRMLQQEQNCGGRVHILTAEMPLPPRTSILGVIKNKVQLNKMLAGVMMNPEFYRHATAGQMHSLIVASTKDVPFEIVGATMIKRRDLSSSSEEADAIIVQHAMTRSMV